MSDQEPMSFRGRRNKRGVFKIVGEFPGVKIKVSIDPETGGWENADLAMQVLPVGVGQVVEGLLETENNQEEHSG